MKSTWKNPQNSTDSDLDTAGSPFVGSYSCTGDGPAGLRADRTSWTLLECCDLELPLSWWISPSPVLLPVTCSSPHIFLPQLFYQKKAAHKKNSMTVFKAAKQGQQYQPSLQLTFKS